jgi:hypothetical protein
MIKWDGGEYDFDFDRVGTAELRAIKKHPDFGFTLRKLLEGLTELDVDAITCVYWLVMRSDGKHDDLVLSTELEFPVIEFMAAWEADKDEAEPDPTPAGFPLDITTLPSNDSSTATSGESAATTSLRSPAFSG